MRNLNLKMIEHENEKMQVIELQNSKPCFGKIMIFIARQTLTENAVDRSAQNC